MKAPLAEGRISIYAQPGKRLVPEEGVREFGLIHFLGGR